MAYIDTKYLFKCETCRKRIDGKCDVWRENGECYSPNTSQIPIADVVPRIEFANGIFDDIERLLFANKIGTVSGLYYRSELKDCIDELKRIYVGD